MNQLLDIVWDQLDISPVFKKCVHIIVAKLVKSESVNEYDFPTSFTSIERQFVDHYCRQYGLKTKRRRIGYNRCITVYKMSSTIVSLDANYGLLEFSQNIIKSLLQRQPVTDKEKKELTFGVHSDHRMASGGGGTGGHNTLFDSNRELNCTTGRLSNIIPQIPPPPVFPSKQRSDETVDFRASLPIYRHQTRLKDVLSSNRIVLINGPTGCGKTTQIPQYILEHCNAARKPCRIICAEPRSLYAHSVAERVSHERKEQIGQTVGYQIRLESKVSPRTLLTFCTNGVLLRTLMGAESPLQSVTHVIVDEIQESDRFTEFLVLVMREMLANYRNLKLILMSSDNQIIGQYAQYFGNCEIVDIDSTPASLQYYYLEDVLRMTAYMSEPMKEYSIALETREAQKQMLNEWIDDINVFTNTTPDFLYGSGDQMNPFFVSSGFGGAIGGGGVVGGKRILSSETVVAERDELDVKLKLRIDSLIRNAWTSGTDYSFQQLIDLIVSEHISVDYQHTATGVTALIAAVAHNKLTIVESLLNYGANIGLCTPNDWSVVQWAQQFGHKDMIELLMAYSKCIESVFYYDELTNLYNSSCGGTELVDGNGTGGCGGGNGGDRQLLELYYHSLIDNNVQELDMNLVCHLIHFILINGQSVFKDQSNAGSILVFLAGYSEIVKVREKIVNDSKRFDKDLYALFSVYPQMPNNDLKAVFRKIRADTGVRKIILATNIAETNLTVNEVSIVIDTGRIREKMFDRCTGFSRYATTWISKSSVYHRRNRANRLKPGLCFHLYDKLRFDRFDDQPIAEMNRMSIYELCLQTKLLINNDVSIGDFLAKAIRPPAIESVKKSVYLLKCIDALEPSEGLTQLGLHLLDLPIEPNLGKMVLYSVVLKCLDPVLTIVCSLSYRSPFIIPQSQASRKRTAFATRKKLSAKTFSDHIILLRGFQNWQKAKHEGCERQFCEQNFVSSASMEMIVNMRAQLLGQLRASGFVRARGAGDIRDLNTNSDEWSVVKAALLAGGYPHLARVDRERRQLITHTDVSARFHPNSVLNTCSLSPTDLIDKSRGQLLDSLPTDWLVFNDMTKLGKTSYLKYCTVVTPVTVALFAGNIQVPTESLMASSSMWRQQQMPTAAAAAGQQYNDPESDSESEDQFEKQKSLLKIDHWIDFKLDPQVAHLTLQLRQKWSSLLSRRMCLPSKPMTPADDMIVKAIVEVLVAEEQSLDLQQPVGIGQRPRPMSTDFCPPISNVPLYSPLNESSLATTAAAVAVAVNNNSSYTRASPQLGYQLIRNNLSPNKMPLFH
ncbi:3'-5' RNA helicase YTHDC2-like [Oppia nitens]|uniref:3'-5' RNA helicase YTHDC2-like n=1 Tax=Oppia nitens TaxID=1686743 RepID=UPI0023DAE28A|nr:3'-5' RNA helicase YTHDC2-like [Oppia nitens]